MTPELEALEASSMSDEPKEQDKRPAPCPPVPRIVAAEQLFLGSREVWIDHGGVRYRLRITRRNRLILQK